MLLTKKQKAYAYIRNQVVSGAFAPTERIREQLLSKQLSVSRGPLREAISQLVSEGLLEQTPGLGVYVKSNSREEIKELYEIREALESFVVYKAAKTIDEGSIYELESVCQRMRALAHDFRQLHTIRVGDQQRKAWLEADRKFHETLYGVSGNRRIAEILNDHRLLTKLFRQKELDKSDVAGQSYLSNISWAWLYHARIVRALKKRDCELARKLMVRHIRRAAARTLALHGEHQEG